MASPQYDVAVVGGGPAGLSTALYTTRLGLETLVIDRGGGRAAMMQDTHNVIGVREEVTGNEFLATAREQIESYGATVDRGFVETIEETETGFELSYGERTTDAKRIVLATGFSDERPDPPLPRTGYGLHYCLHCDAYMFADEPVYVMGAGDAAAHVAMIMLNVTGEVDLLTRGDEPTWSEETATMLEHHPIDVVTEEVTGMERREDGWLEAFTFADGSERSYRGGFAMYGSDYNAELADGLGLERTESGEVAVDEHGETSRDGVYAVGDLTPGHNQIPVAMGEGADAGIAIHKDLRPFPRSIEAIERDGAVTPEEVPAMRSSLRSTAVSHPGHAGGPRADSGEADD